MATITNIGRAECRILSADLETAVSEVVAAYGLIARYATGSYGGHTARLSFDIDVPQRAERVANRSAELLGAEFQVGDVFEERGREYRVTEFNLRRPKYPVGAECVLTGRRYKFTLDGVNRLVRKEAI
jgi:hypothetical protein|tara:strand:+ start:193 stop:576 length:384 start_codon:yes stop_codon:yes gene_type:complete